MKSFKDYSSAHMLHEEFVQALTEETGVDAELIQEAMIMLTGQKDAQFGNIVIMAGGAGSGKGFVIDNLVQISGKVMDVDALKQAAIKSKKISARVKEELGYDLKSFNLKNPEDVGRLHAIVNDELKIPDKVQSAFFSSVYATDPSRKPNILFDVTLKDLKKLQSISMAVRDLGYDMQKIHIIWVANDVVVARAQNQKRDRVVPDEILVNTHAGVSITMKGILEMGATLKNYMDGAIVFSFNSAGVDTEIVSAGKNTKNQFTKGGFKIGFIKKANYVFVKKPGKPQMSPDELSDEVVNKLRAYTSSVTKAW